MASLPKYKIGVILPLSGANASYGTWIKNGLDLACQEINQNKYKFKLSLIYEDDHTDPSIAAQKMKKLCERNKVTAIFGSWSSSCVLAQAPLAQKYQTMVLAEAISPRVAQTNEFIFNIQPDARYYLHTLIPFLHHTLKIKSAYTLYLDNDFGKDQQTYFQKLFEQTGGKILGNSAFAQRQTNFSEILLRIKQMKPQAVFVPAYLEIVDILRQARQAGLDSQFVASVPFENPQILKTAGTAAEGVIYPYHYISNLNNPRQQKFYQAYRHYYQTNPEGFAALAYDGLYVIAEALKIYNLLAYIKNITKLDRILLKDSLKKIHYYGSTGEIIFENTGYPIKNIQIKTVKHSTFIAYKDKDKEEENFLETIPFCPPYPDF